MAGVGRDRLGCLWPTIDDSSTSSPAIRNSAWRPIEGRELAELGSSWGASKRSAIGKQSSWPQALDPLRIFGAFAVATAEFVPAKGGGEHGTKMEAAGCPVKRGKRGGACRRHAPGDTSATGHPGAPIARPSRPNRGMLTHLRSAPGGQSPMPSLPIQSASEARGSTAACPARTAARSPGGRFWLSLNLPSSRSTSIVTPTIARFMPSR